MTTLAFTGHRYLKDEGQKAWAINKLNEICLRAASKDTDCFISGGAPGADWWFTDAAWLARWQLAGKPASEPASVSGFPKDGKGIIVSMALPFKGFLNYYMKKNSSHEEYIKERLVKYVEPIIIVNNIVPEGRPQMTQLIHARNRWLVDNQSVIVGLYDGRGSGGTFATLKYAKKKKRRILWLNPTTQTEKWVNTNLF
jgi:hypothetical protein